MSFPITISISAEAVAWYGALVSSILLVIKLLEYWRERPRLIVKPQLNQFIVNDHTGRYSPDKNYISVTVINKGRRPITIKTVGYIIKGKKKAGAILTDSLIDEQRELTEGKSTIYIIEQDKVELEEVKYFFVYDLTDKEYKGKLKK